MKDKKYLFQQLELVISSPKFIHDMQAFRKKWHISEKGLSFYPPISKKTLEWRKWISSENRLVSFNEDLDLILNLYNLSSFWRVTLSNYLTYGELFIPSTEGISLERDKSTGEWKLSVEISPFTKFADYKKMWPEVMKYQPLLPGFRKTMRGSKVEVQKRNKKIIELHNAGLNSRQIAEKLLELGENYLFQLTEDDIRQIIHKTKVSKRARLR